MIANLCFDTEALTKTKRWTEKPPSCYNWARNPTVSGQTLSLYLCIQRRFLNGGIPCESLGDRACIPAALLHLGRIDHSADSTQLGSRLPVIFETETIWA